MTRPCDQNIVDGRGVFRALDELSDLPFVARNDYRYICKHCLDVLKKRNRLKMNLEKLGEKLFNDYKQLCQERGVAVKTRNPAKHSLPFKDIACGSNTSNPCTPEAPAPQENIIESESSSSK